MLVDSSDGYLWTFEHDHFDLSGVIFSMLACISETVSRFSTFPLRPHVAQLWSSVGTGVLRDERCTPLLQRVTGIMAARRRMYVDFGGGPYPSVRLVMARTTLRRCSQCASGRHVISCVCRSFCIVIFIFLS